MVNCASESGIGIMDDGPRVCDAKVVFSMHIFDWPRARPSPRGFPLLPARETTQDQGARAPGGPSPKTLRWRILLRGAFLCSDYYCSTVSHGLAPTDMRECSASVTRFSVR